MRINLAGVPQIPDALARMIVSAQGDDAEPTGALLEESEASIEAACREIRRRTELDRRRDSALTWRQAQ